MHHEPVSERTLDGPPDLEEIWGTRRLVTMSARRRAEELTSEEIWGPDRGAEGRDVPPTESIWGDPNTAASPSPPPHPTYRRPFTLPAAWAASSRPGRHRWRRRLDAFGRLSRRTG